MANGGIIAQSMEAGNVPGKAMQLANAESTKNNWKLAITACGYWQDADWSRRWERSPLCHRLSPSLLPRPPSHSHQLAKGVPGLEGEFRAEEAAAQPHQDKQSKYGLTLGV